MLRRDEGFTYEGEHEKADEQSDQVVSSLVYLNLFALNFHFTFFFIFTHFNFNLEIANWEY